VRTTYRDCGLTAKEHKRVAKARRRAEKEARKLMVEAREREQLPRALIKEVYDKAERDVKARGGAIETSERG
ncbi:MAG: hypothetical protein WCF17_17525, partial [Terracidiphilus sp.]